MLHSCYSWNETACCSLIDKQLKMRPGTSSRMIYTLSDVEFSSKAVLKALPATSHLVGVKFNAARQDGGQKWI